MSADRSRVLAAALFGTLAVVAAFIVSALAGGGDASVPGGAAGAPDRGVARADTVVPGEIRVEVLNGAGSAGLARDAMRRLREEGFDVVYFGNAARFDHGRSFVLDRSGRASGARAVAAALGIDSVAADVDRTLLLDVSVVLGEDWPPAPPPPGGWATRAREWLGRDTLD